MLILPILVLPVIHGFLLENNHSVVGQTKPSSPYLKISAFLDEKNRLQQATERIAQNTVQLRHDMDTNLAVLSSQLLQKFNVLEQKLGEVKQLDETQKELALIQHNHVTLEQKYNRLINSYEQLKRENDLLHVEFQLIKNVSISTSKELSDLKHLGAIQPLQDISNIQQSVQYLLSTFSKVQHVFLVGVGGSVPDYEDASKHVILGDIVISLPSQERSWLYVHFQKIEHTLRTDEYKFNVKHWACADDTLQKVVEKIRKVTDSSPDPERPLDIYLEEASERLKAEESSFHRPFINTDRLYYTNPDGTVTVVEVQHPSGDKNYIEGRTNVRFGTISNGMNIATDGKLRKTFARLYGIKAYDLDTDAILESLDGNRNESFLIIRGLPITQMEAVKSGNHIVPWPRQRI
ncbi:unnamed protein product [Mytilus coruscus]|uniref:Uncharacterized protein n=1 Tax=Mytilus coruscus TaxID=42192 RepID=A0A6J8DRF1_MYTCO|nr:unnamed protein product [Mytilus coruscus]